MGAGGGSTDTGPDFVNSKPLAKLFVEVLIPNLILDRPRNSHLLTTKFTSIVWSKNDIAVRCKMRVY